MDVSKGGVLDCGLMTISSCTTCMHRFGGLAPSYPWGQLPSPSSPLRFLRACIRVRSFAPVWVPCRSVSTSSSHVLLLLLPRATRAWWSRRHTPRRTSKPEDHEAAHANPQTQPREFLLSPPKGPTRASLGERGSVRD